MSQDTKDIEQVTTAIATEAPPDSKTRRYDRQLRLWAATGQAALESAHLLVLSSTATSTSILKNLVLPGVGAFTILDDTVVTSADAGNNFFLEGPLSIGRPRAQEAVRLLGELNEGVRGNADIRNVEQLLAAGKSELFKYTLVIAHNLPRSQLERLSQLLWEDEDAPPLVVVRSAGFLAEFFIQQHEHTVIESHSETTPSLRIDKPFPALLRYAQSLDLNALDPTDHGHVPYVILLVKAMGKWKQEHNGSPPQSSAERNAFKELIRSMKRKIDEENFEEAEAQAYRSWTETIVPREVKELFNDSKLQTLSASSPPFFHLLAALKRFAAQPPYTLPLTSTLPDMKASTDAYIGLQRLYKDQVEREKGVFKSFISPEVHISDDLIDSFVKNAHALKVIRGTSWDSIDKDANALGNAAAVSPKQLAIHLALSAASSLASSAPATPEGELPVFTVEALRQEAQSLLSPGTELPEEFEHTGGELARSPTADLPNTAALLGGLVAQEVIKMITKQYIPIAGICTVDLIETWTGIL
ncbi:NEDD8-activating enzyme E1 regulatory subunit [Leucoagaricus sp. SymC.cos]|nr:NEDD8-activating enzyme E1 regulatory subunit [Leucoagaricus sp. SymC.cos]